MIEAVEYKEDDLDYLLELNDLRPVEAPPKKISMFAESKRVMPSNTPFPGPVDLSRTPYVIEPMDHMSPYSPIQRVSCMKAAQVGWTFSAENVMGYFMEALPTVILYITATFELLERWARKRLDPLIDSIGMRERITAQTDNKQSRRSGDKTYSKEFIGGALEMASAQSPGSLRSESVRLLVIDEKDGAPAQLRTGEGNFGQVASARTIAWGMRKKIYEFSTPTTYEESLIWADFQAGDQRYYNVPCPHCNGYQVLKFKNLKPVVEKGFLKTVFYECEHCAGEIYNHHKTEMLRKGIWKATAIPKSVYHRSYQISALYSPVGMLSFKMLYEKYLEAQEDPDGMRWFTQIYLGEPYKESGTRPHIDKVLELRGTYRTREIPDGVLFLTVGADMQLGSKKDKSNPPRLEVEICGHGEKFRTWSIEYQRFEGEVAEDAYSGAWQAFYEWIESGKLSYIRRDGMVFQPKIILIDSGEGSTSDVVYAFCQRLRNTFPSKGYSILRKRKLNAGDQAGPHNFVRYRKSKIGEDTILYTISTTHYKTHIYNNLKVPRIRDDLQRPGFCEFPIDRDENYFKMLVAEEKRSDGSFHDHGRRNEALDCRVLNKCAADIWLDAQVRRVKENAKRQGKKDYQLAIYTHAFFLDYLRKKTARIKAGESGEIPFKN